MGILGILDTRGKILETGGIFVNSKNIFKIEKKIENKLKKIEIIQSFRNERNEKIRDKTFP